MIQIYYKGKPSDYPLYETVEQAIQAMITEGLDEEQLNDMWTSPRGLEKITTFEEVEG